MYNDTEPNAISNQQLLLTKEPWYHHATPKETAEIRIRKNGEFLVRLSTHDDSKFVLTTKWNGRLMHMLVNKRTAFDEDRRIYERFFLEEYEQPSVVELIRFLWINQLPISRGSGAIICRPVPYEKWVQETRSESKLNKGYPARPRHWRNKGQATRGLAGSMNDLSLETTNVDKRPNRMGTSVVDLRFETYVDPDSLGLDGKGMPMISNNLGASATSLQPSMNNRKPSTISRKQIRYLEMADAPSVRHLSSNDVIPTSSSHPINFDLTPPFPLELANRIGSPSRALEDTVWKRVSLLHSSRGFTPLSCAGHMVEETIRLLTACHVLDSDWTNKGWPLTSFTVLHPCASEYRQACCTRDRSLSLFVTATILFATTQSARTRALAFWIEVVQCLNTIYRDHHSLGVVLEGLLSSQISRLKTIWTRLSISSRPVSRINVDELQKLYTFSSLILDANGQIQTTLSADCMNQIPNLRALLQADDVWYQTDWISGQARLSTSSDAVTTERCWSRELQLIIPTNKDSLASHMARTEIILTLLLGPINLGKGEAIATLTEKLNQVLQKMSTLIEPD